MARQRRAPSRRRGASPLHPAGYFTTRSDTDIKVNARTSGVYLRACTEDMSILDGPDDRKRAELIVERLKHWKSITNA